MNYARKIDWLPDDLTNNNDFEKTFGFTREYENQNIEDIGRYINLNYEDDLNLSLKGYQQLIRLHFYTTDSEMPNKKEIFFEVEGSAYTVIQQQEDSQHTVTIKDEKDKEQIKLDMQSIFDTLMSDENLKNTNKKC